MTADARTATAPATERGIAPELLAELLARFGHTSHSACAIDIDPTRTNVFIAERDATGETTGRICIETFDTTTGLPLFEELP